MDNRIALKVRAAVSASGLGQSTLYELMASGALPYVKVGASRLILRADLEAFLVRHRVEEAA